MSDIIASCLSINLHNMQNDNGIIFKIYGENAVTISIPNRKAVDLGDYSIGIEGMDIDVAYQLRDFLNYALPDKEDKDE